MKANGKISLCVRVGLFVFTSKENGGREEPPGCTSSCLAVCVLRARDQRMERAWERVLIFSYIFAVPLVANENVLLL